MTKSQLTATNQLNTWQESTLYIKQRLLLPYKILEVTIKHIRTVAADTCH